MRRDIRFLPRSGGSDKERGFDIHLFYYRLEAYIVNIKVAAGEIHVNSLTLGMCRKTFSCNHLQNEDSPGPADVRRTAVGVTLDRMLLFWRLPWGLSVQVQMGKFTCDCEDTLQDGNGVYPFSITVFHRFGTLFQAS